MIRGEKSLRIRMMEERDRLAKQRAKIDEKLKFIDAMLEPEKAREAAEALAAATRRVQRSVSVATDAVVAAAKTDAVKEKPLKVPEIALKTLAKYPDEWFGSSVLAKRAVEIGIWADPPKTYPSVMSGALGRMIKDDEPSIRFKELDNGNRLYRHKEPGSLDWFDGD